MSEEELVKFLGYALPAGFEIQTGAETKAPSVIFADADYEVGDGKCGLHETIRNANEPTIVYVRADTINALRERVKVLEGALGNIAMQKKTLELETEYDVECADFEGGYDAIIDIARAALKTGLE